MEALGRLDRLERNLLADLFAAIGNATNETINEMPTFSDERVPRQMMHTFAAVGGFVTYADMLKHATNQASSDSSAAIVRLGQFIESSHRSQRVVIDTEGLGRA